MSELTWGVLSVSGHYRQRIQLPLRDSSLVKVAAIASRSRERAEAAAAEFGIPKAFASYEDLLADPEIRAVYIPLPNSMHAEWVRKAADAGKHILCEKPFTMNADETAAAVEYARSRGVKVMEAFMYRLHPQWKRVRDLVKVGEIGDVHGVNVFFSYNNQDPSNIRNRKEVGGGALYDIGCYAVSSSRFILDREPERVVSRIVRDPDFGTDILTSAIMDFGGPRATFTVGTQSAPFQRVDVLGSKGSLTVHLPFNMYPDVPAKITVTTSIGSRDILFPVRDQYAELFEQFSLAVLEDRPVPTPPQDAVENQKVLDAIFRSAETGQWETV
ncbi:Gfo/Idh/MocA family oxidoreductase [Marispirochaeta aestuarii]|uniref:Gfo/Idh/MocA family protein n=1 Tax=Marispirochaeta aestuarii TaxID=1963862 RepID=UPI0029C9174A|nr:Gfo/Idh/MocA family oxidoreductase [Marispirochaeta aestuarii]